MARYNLTTPVTYTQNGTTKTRYTRVGTVFENTREDGSKCLSIKLDFPIGATELVAFEPRTQEEGEGESRDGGL
ncbi:hypothetical protein [Jannaschia sp. M317]|uniref:hypothetical protein n=1 Tax=Jannaschia sp. M317 TaxID=2867011 RepID=UPI0021A778E7|nr:hypothetical protein [Jannaschia sp. M317]UWQ19697.1 hypothetical protein K3551_18690 [Jannaschia sp. M317]